jgi:hypothetical protein
MSVDPSFVRSAPQDSEDQVTDLASPPHYLASPAGPEIRCVEVLPLRPGDRLVVHVDGAAGMSAGGAERIGAQIQETLKLDELGFDVPLIVVSPGIRVEIARPG